MLKWAADRLIMLRFAAAVYIQAAQRGRMARRQVAQAKAEAAMATESKESTDGALPDRAKTDLVAAAAAEMYDQLIARGWNASRIRAAMQEYLLETRAQASAPGEAIKVEPGGKGCRQ